MEKQTKICNQGDACVTGNPEQPLENFNKRKRSADGRTYTCKACERDRAKQSYYKRKELGLLEMTEEQKQARREYYRDYYDDTKEKRREYQRNYRKSDEGKQRIEDGRKRREERIEQQGGRGDYRRWDVITKDSIDGVLYCQICKKEIEKLDEMQIDHIVPISQGGKDELDNVRCVHETCNKSRKRT